MDYLDDEGAVLSFMRRFAGIAIRIPTMPVVERIAKDLHISRSLQSCPTTANVRRLSRLHGINMRAVAKSFSKSNGQSLKRLRRPTPAEASIPGDEDPHREAPPHG